MSKRLRNENTGAVVVVRDDKVLGSEWAPIVVEVKAPQRPKKQDSKESD